MFISTSTCSFKCEAESGICCCQNSDLAKAPKIDVSIKMIIGRYISNPITQSICFGGLEPIDQFSEICEFINTLRTLYYCNDDVVIYTGYKKNEISSEVDILREWPNIIVKFGRYVPGQEPHFDPVLGVKLASDNQYGEVIS